jgi:hypothetical protein
MVVLQNSHILTLRESGLDSYRDEEREKIDDLCMVFFPSDLTTYSLLAGAMVCFMEVELDILFTVWRGPA